jgi:hypothetical protein
VKAPDSNEPFSAPIGFGYSAEQWREVVRELAKIDIDVATVVRFVPPGCDYEIAVPLGDALQQLAKHFSVLALLRGAGNPLLRGAGNPKTPKQLAKKLAGLLTKLKAARDVLGLAYSYAEDGREALELSSYYIRGEEPPEQLRARVAERSARADMVHNELTGLIVRLEGQNHLYEATAYDGRRKSAVRLHDQFWLALLQLSPAIPNIGRRHKKLHRFLSICSQSLFPTATTGKALDAFIERHFPRTKI